MTQGLNIDKLKKVMVESYPDKVLKDLDGRSSTTKPSWTKKKPTKPFKKRPYPVKAADGLDDDEDEYEDGDDDVQAIDDYHEDEEYGDEVWYGDEDAEDEEWDEDQVAYVDEDGWFHADEETINAVDEMMSYDDAEYAAILTTYTEARGALAKARIARGFYPVVVPADSGLQPRFGRQPQARPKAKAKPKAKGGGRGKSGKGKGAGGPNPNPSSGPKGKGKSRPAPICFRCGKRGHTSLNCTNPPLLNEKGTTNLQASSLT